MKDIVERLGVSVVTASKVLGNHTDIGAATRRRVLQKVKGSPVSVIRAMSVSRSPLDQPGDWVCDSPPAHT